MRKILFVATVADHFRCFYLPYFDMFSNNGWMVSTACSDTAEVRNCENNYVISINRSPLSKENILAYRQLKKIIACNEFDIIHCGTPIGGFITRIAARKARKRGAKVIYTAHGFHFFIGASVVNWLIYFPIELILSRLTDCLITINHEDCNFAKKHFKACETVYVHGVGYDNEKFFKPSKEKKHELRKKNGYSDSVVLLVYAAELNENKNQKLLIEALEIITKTRGDVRLLLIGQDNLYGKNQKLAKKLGLTEKVNFLGKRTDVDKLLPMCDIAVASSRREGLPVNIMESLACGLPVVAADNRGHRELVKNGKNGYLVKPDDSRDLAHKVIEIIENEDLYRYLSENARKSVNMFCKDSVLGEMKNIYGRM